MKKILIICLLLLSGCTNTIQLENKKILSTINLDNFQNIMIVAHPDDESLWGGMHLLQDNYLVICLTNGDNPTRAKEFKQAMQKTNNLGLILDYPDKTNGKRDNWKNVAHNIENDINYLLNNHQFNTIVTHNPNGEYGHAHHKMTSAIVTKVAKKLSYDNSLYYFGHYYKKNDFPLKKNPIYDNNLLQQKTKLIATYSSQNKTCQKFQHMLAHEDWIKYQDWY